MQILKWQNVYLYVPSPDIQQNIFGNFLGKMNKEMAINMADVESLAKAPSLKIRQINKLYDPLIW
jgi:hypothetical protein